MTTNRPLRKIGVDSAAQLPVMIDRIVRCCDPVKIILFGSQARGDARPDSDVDLLVVLPHVESKTDATGHILDLFADLLAGVDVIVTTPKEIEEFGGIAGSLLRPALREGKVLYERSAA